MPDKRPRNEGEDEIFVILGNKELFLTIRWYTGEIFYVGDEVEVSFMNDDEYVLINGIPYQHEQGKFYILK